MYIVILICFLAFGSPFARYEKLKRRFDLRKGEILEINGVKMRMAK